MSQPSSQSSTSSFQGLFNAALNDYENQTGTKLVEHPLAEKFEACDSVDSIIAVFQEQAQIFRKFKDDGKMMKSIKSSVGVLYTLSNSTLLGEGAGLVRPKYSSGFLVLNCYSTGFPARKRNLHGDRYTTRCLSLPSNNLCVYP
jgi:hypothetical protein